MSQRHETTMEHLLGSRVRARVVAAFVLEPERTWYLQELLRGAGNAIAFTRREIGELERMRLIRHRRCGRGIFFEVDTCHPFFEPLRALTVAAQRIDVGYDPRPYVFKMPYEYRGDEFYPCKVRGERGRKSDASR